MNKLIFHIDVNSAFLSWEAVFRICHLGAKTDLREIPSAIGGDVKMRHGIILAKSIPAKKYRIQTGESILEAQQKCKDLYLAPPNYRLYETCSRAFMDILRDYTPDVEQYSIDEAYMDMTGTENMFGEPIEAASGIKDRIREELGFTVNVGVSNNKLLAKMASDMKKPDLVHTLYPYEIEKKMWPLPVSELFFVGRATTEKLFRLGIQTIGELAKTDPAILRSYLKKQGEIIWGFANGIDLTEVQAVPPSNKGYGNSTTIAFDVRERGTAHTVLLALSETVAQRLRKDGVKAGIVQVGIKTKELEYYSHQMVLPAATNITNELYQYACQIFDEAWRGEPIRHLGVHTGRIGKEDGVRQLNLFDDMEYEKWHCYDNTIDAIRERYGIDAVKRAVFLESPIDHMSGGVSREKRTVDYSKLSVM